MIRVAACQLNPASTSEERKLQAQVLLRRAESEGVDFLCFPEGFLTGYYAEESMARKHSLEVGDAAFGEWLDIFKDSGVTSIVGFNEKKGSNLFDAAAVIEQGRLIGVQRKHYLYHGYFTSSSSFTLFQCKGIAFGVVICLDTVYFEPARLLALQGASLLFSPMCNRVPLDHHYAKRPSYYSHFIARCFENRCWLVTADWVLPSDHYSICAGHTVIYDPDGQEIARSREGEEQLLISDIPMDRLFHEKGRRVHGSIPLRQEIAKLSV